MSKTTLLEYLKSENKQKEIYQIPLTKEELFYTNEENPKFLNKLVESKVIQDFVFNTDDADDETKEKMLSVSPFCLALQKKGYLSNQEQKDLISSKDEMAQQVKILATMCNLYGQGANPKNLDWVMQDITGQTPKEEELDNPNLTEEEKKQLQNSIVAYNQVTPEEKKALAGTLGNPDNAKILETLLNLNESGQTDKLIQNVTRFFELRFPNLKLSNNEIASLHKDVLEKISLFIRYESMRWDVKAVPQELKRFVLSIEG
jgi:hypothetical protein